MPEKVRELEQRVVALNTHVRFIRRVENLKLTGGNIRKHVRADFCFGFRAFDRLAFRVAFGRRPCIKNTRMQYRRKAKATEACA